MTVGVSGLTDDLTSIRSSGKEHSRPPWIVAVALAIAGVAYRVGMLVNDTPPTNSDEATMGLAALHIATGQNFPVYFYGQHHMGVLEAYLAAPLFLLFGSSVPAVRLPNLLLFTLFLLVMWKLTRRLYPSPWFATLVIAVLALGSDRILKNQLIAGGGYPEMNPAGALLFLLALNLALDRVRRRLLAFTAWGLVAGIMLWVDLLLLPYLACAAVILAVFNWRQLRGGAGLALLTTAVLGAAPALGYSVATGQNPLTVLAGLSGGGTPASWADRLFGGVLFGVPMGTGFCSPGRCSGVQMWWGVLLPVLMIIAAAIAYRAVRRGDATDRVLAACRLALIAAAGLTLAAYGRSNAAGNTPVESARYLSCLAISTPAILWPLWSAARSQRPGTIGRATGQPVAAWRAARRPVSAALLVAVLASMSFATFQVTTAVPAMRQEADQRRALVATLRGLDVHHFYSEYWTCNNITFATREEIVCAVVDDELRPGLDRYEPYRRLVTVAGTTTYVLPADSPVNALLVERLHDGPTASTVISIPAYRIYLLSDKAASGVP